ncbi:unnamed protein product [Paramecium octaurelia]|uniref:Uncharacterized protein n=1 Tax=Paramecium octaurelia TaxID=43137 RepID=A0A8S1XJG7_PAROT|nr:unnamed protein product [Paramecium octaurelia]
MYLKSCYIMHKNATLQGERTQIVRIQTKPIIFKRKIKQKEEG